MLCSLQRTQKFCQAMKMNMLLNSYPIGVFIKKKNSNRMKEIIRGFGAGDLRVIECSETRTKTCRES